MAQKNVLNVRVDKLEGEDIDDVADPFAIDIFAQNTTVNQTDAEQTISIENEVENLTEQIWFQTLPKLSADEVRQTKITFQLPSLFSSDVSSLVAQTLSDCVTNQTDKAFCEIVASEETDFQTEAETLVNENAVFINFTVEPYKQQGVLVLDALFAVELISKNFGDESNPENRRGLSVNELAVLEFFALCCFRKANEFLNEPLFRLHTAEQSAPGWLKRNETDFVQTKKRGILSKIKLVLGQSVGIVLLFAPYDLFESLNEKSNPLLTDRESDKQITRLSKMISGVTLKIVVGETSLNTSDLLILEPDDVILIERPLVNLSEQTQTLFGNVNVKIGSETTTSCYGQLSADYHLQLQITEINQLNKLDDSTRLKMQENEDESTDYESTEQEHSGTIALNKIVVTLHVQIASRRVSLEELASLRVNQVIELGAKPTDPVELVADGKTVAIGELINIEDNLGVRLKRILL